MILWKTRDTNALGQITKYETGNGVVSQREYDDRHFLSAQLATKGNVKIQDFAYRYDIFGNFAARIENKYTTPLEERFTYDYLNRLDSIILNNGTSNVMTYDAYGRIRSKMRDGQIVFDNAEYQFYDGNGSLKPHAISAANVDESAFGPFLYEGVTYNLFDKVDTINLANHKRFCFDYGYDHQRIRMTTINNGILELQKTYVDNTEFVTGGGNYAMTYLCGPMGVFAVVRTTNNADECQYVYKDHLGSWTTLTDDQGVIEQEQSFDAWGNCRNPQTWTDYPSNQDVFIRGFCGHEHLWITSFGRYDVGLINMNGRIYDPIMSSFLSVDNYVQAPGNSQSFNRYAYCLNNPLKYTDPDGEFWHLVIGAVVGGVVNVGINAKYIDTFWQGLGYFGIGALAGGLSVGVGAGVGIAYAGESFAAGFLGTTVQAAPCALGFYGGLLVGGASGFVSASITTAGNSWMQNTSFTEGLITGLRSGFVSGLVCGVAYGMVGGFCAELQGKNFADASMDYDLNLINRKMPKVQQTEKNCVGAVAESCSIKDGTGITQEQIRTQMGVDPSIGLEDRKAMETYVNMVGDYNYSISGEVSDAAKSTVIPEASYGHMLDSDTHTWINLNQDNGHEVVLNRIYKSVHIDPKGRLTISNWKYEVMDPWIGDYRNIKIGQIQGSNNILYLKLNR